MSEGLKIDTGGELLREKNGICFNRRDARELREVLSCASLMPTPNSARQY